MDGKIGGAVCYKIDVFFFSIEENHVCLFKKNILKMDIF
jgi:hypothetical protein